MQEIQLAWVGMGAGAAAIIFAVYLMINVLKESMGTQQMRELSLAIYEGAMSYLNTQYRALVPFTLIIFAALFLAENGPALAVSFLVGAVSSAVAGYLGMTSTTRANARTCHAARRSLNMALFISFRAGTVMGISVVGLALLGVSALFLLFQSPVIINSFAFGASVIAFFARVGGGIYTKAADVGADLVGKVETGIPEDDPRNPAVIADNVGDNVGDTAGMGADLFESYAATTIAAMIIGNSLFGITGAVFPLFIGAAGIIGSIASTFLVSVREDGNPQAALNRGLLSTNIITAFLAYWAATSFFAEAGPGIFLSVATGLLVSVIIGYLTEYYTSNQHRPTRQIAGSAETGAATNIIQGLAVGMESTFFPMLVFAAAIWLSYLAAGLGDPSYSIFGIAMAAMGMLSVAGMVIAMDSFGPVADNAGGIAEMAGLEPDVRRRTDELDAVGNTTAAVAKGFAVGSAALTALALFTAFSNEVAANPRLAHLLSPEGWFIIDLSQPGVIAGLFAGAAVPFLVSARTLKAVGVAAFDMIHEVRRQFAEIPGLLEGKARPDYARAVAISTRAAIKEMLFPGLLAVGIPLVVGFVLGAKALAGFLAGMTASGVLLALFLANSGGAWDNAKKYIEAGCFGGRGTEAHSASVIGDTVGDPCKDTAGPSMNPLIKVAGTFSLIIAPFLIR